LDAIENKRNGWLVWVVLALWFAWLLTLAILSYPEWGKSKIELMEPADHEK
jgi:cell division septal protein FtsQ